MKKLYPFLNAFFEQVPDKLRTQKWRAWILFVSFTVLMIAGIPRLKSQLSFEYFFSADDPVMLAYNEMRNTFGSDEIIYIMYRAKDGDILSSQSLKALYDLQNEIEDTIFDQSGSISHLTEVRTLINADYLESKGDTLITSEFIGNRLPKNKNERESIREKALADTNTYAGIYISDDSRHGGVIIRTDFNTEVALSNNNSDDMTSIDDEDDFSDEEEPVNKIPVEEIKFKKTAMSEYKIAVDSITKILNQKKYTEIFEYKKVGKPVQMAWAMQTMREEMGTVMTGAFVIIALTLFALFRSISAILWPLLIVVFSVVYTLGFMGWTGIFITTFTQIVIFLILAVGVADAIHILSGYVCFREQGKNHEEALRKVYRKSGVAIFFTTLTTSVGLMALVFVPIEPIKYFGLVSAFGIWIALAITVLVLPLMIELWAPRKKNVSVKISNRYLQKWFGILEKTSKKYKILIISVFTLLGIVSIIGGSQIKIDSNDVKALKKSAPIRQAVEAVDRLMAGSYNMVIMIDSGMSNGFKIPRILSRIDAVQQTLEKKYPGIITQTVSLANIVKNSYKLLNKGKKEFYTIPTDATLLSQVLFLFDMSNSKDRRQIITDDYRKGRINLTLKNLGTRDGNLLFNDIKEILDETFADIKVTHPKFKITLTGQLAMSTRLSSYITSSQIRSFGIAFAVITLLMPIIVGSFTTGLIAMLPNIFPVVALFGVMGLFQIPLEVHTLLVAPIIIGIAVDDTIHFLTHFQMEKAYGATVEEAIHHTYQEVGQAITFTSIVLSMGFLIFVTSSSLGITYFGSLSALAMFIALAGDLLLLPAMLSKR